MKIEHSGDRLRQFTAPRSITPTWLADKFGVSTQSVNNWFSRGVPKKDLYRVSQELGIRFEWLDSGDGLPLMEGIGDARDRDASGALSEIEAWDDDTPLRPDEVWLPFLEEVELDAGPGMFAVEESPSAKLRFFKQDLRRNSVQFDKAKCVSVSGNSMVPVLRDGATVGVNVGKNSLKDVVDGEMYAINHNGQLRVKQVYRLPTGLRFRSYNRDEYPDEDYTFAEIQEQQISIIGHVFWWAMFS
ncbi:HTH-type transcriptional regulator prtR [Pseudomonas antarctica]|uniref:HTH-type transcriptional regulator prtR n=1 Tax=Pseudomonas antarctica TaxID=219572 RepID=A0A172Z5B3_9PSED|nr:S24 family peptidase [Pseudomonas antarctica]ANF87169.1 HTH-type transcriptional regulator prtR [Pseudomonas antarctica]